METMDSEQPHAAKLLPEPTKGREVQNAPLSDAEPRCTAEAPNHTRHYPVGEPQGLVAGPVNPGGTAELQAVGRARCADSKYPPEGDDGTQTSPEPGPGTTKCRYCDHRSGEQINNARYRASSHQSATRWLCLGSGWQLGNSLCFRTGRPAGMCYNLLSPRCSPPFHPSPNKGPAMFAPCLTDHIPCRIGNSVPLDVAPAVP